MSLREPLLKYSPAKYRGKEEKEMSIKFSGGKKSGWWPKVAALVLAFMLVVGASISGTLAWLTAKGETVKIVSPTS